LSIEGLYGRRRIQIRMKIIEFCCCLMSKKKYKSNIFRKPSDMNKVN